MTTDEAVVGVLGIEPSGRRDPPVRPATGFGEVDGATEPRIPESQPEGADGRWAETAAQAARSASGVVCGRILRWSGQPIVRLARVTGDIRYGGWAGSVRQRQTTALS